MGEGLRARENTHVPGDWLVLAVVNATITVVGIVGDFFCGELYTLLALQKILAV